MIDFDFVSKPTFCKSFLDVFFLGCAVLGQSFEERMYLRYAGDIEGVLRDGEF